MIKIKKMITIALLSVSVLPAMMSCNSDDEAYTPTYEEVNYVSLNGTWRLSEWKGQTVGTTATDPYVYITFNRKEHTFEMYENTGSMYSHRTTAPSRWPKRKASPSCAANTTTAAWNGATTS